MIPQFLAKMIGKLITATILKKIMGRVTILVLRNYANSTLNTLDNDIVDTIEDIIIKGK